MHTGSDPLLLRGELLRQGSTDSEIRTAKADGIITSLRRGAYVSTAALSGMRPEDEHLLAVRAHLAAARSELVVSHQSAAVVHGLPMWAPDLTKVHATIDRTSGGRTTKTRHVHAAHLAAADVTDIRSVRVTTPNRTVADLLRLLPFEAGVCIADAALRTGSARIAGIEEALRRTNCRGALSAQRTLEFCDPGSESVGESRSRVHLNRLGFPSPELQVNLYSPAGRFLGRPDFLFRNEGVLGEFDGSSKYLKYLKPGQTPSDAVVAEKKREDTLRSYGWIVSRWTWSDLENPNQLAATLQRAFDVARTLPTPRTVTPL